METSYLLCDNHVVHAAFFSKHHEEHARLFERPMYQLYPSDNMCFQSENFKKSRQGRTDFVPIKQETIYQPPYYSFIVFFTLFKGFKFFYPFLAYFLFDFNLLLLVEVIMASMIGWDYTRLLDMTKEFNETIP